jgi:DNA-binding LacI/PurR family transcriptional regulator
MGNKKVTIADVAREAGVSPTAVSQIMNEKGSFPDDTRKRVMSVASRLHYRPNRAAASLRSGKTHTVGLVVSGSNDPLWSSRWVQVTAQIMVELAEELNRRGYALLIIPSETLERITPDEVDALILSDSLIDDPVLETAFQQEIPVVTNDRLEDQRVTVHVDSGYRAMAHFALTHFVESGRTRPGLLAEPDTYASDFSVEEVWREDCARLGLDILVERVPYDRSTLDQAVTSLLDKGIDSLFAFTGEGAEIVDIITRSGRQVGQDVALISSEMEPDGAVLGAGGDILLYNAQRAAQPAVEALVQILDKGAPSPSTVKLGFSYLTGHQIGP